MRKTIPYLVVALLLLLVITAREWIDRRWAGGPPSGPIPVDFSLGEWRGEDLALDKEVLEMLKPDQLIFRRYKHPEGQTALVYGIFYLSQGTDRTMHSPMNCYPGSGWEIVDTEEVNLHGLTRPDIKIKAQKAIIRKGLEERVLYFWYYAGGKVAANQYLNKALTLYGAVVNGRTDGGLVTISTDFGETSKNQEDFEKNFISRIIDGLANHPVAQ